MFRSFFLIIIAGKCLVYHSLSIALEMVGVNDADAVFFDASQLQIIAHFLQQYVVKGGFGLGGVEGGVVEAVGEGVVIAPIVGVGRVGDAI
mgnify:CR=1 FL=1